MRYLIILILFISSRCYASDMDPIYELQMKAFAAEDKIINDIKDLDGAVNFYENLGRRLSDYERKVDSLYREGKLSAGERMRLIKTYNNLRGKQITSGNLIIDSIEQPRLKEVNTIKYRRLKKEIMMELDKLETFEGRGLDE